MSETKGEPLLPEPEIGDFIEMDNGTFGVEKGEIVAHEEWSKAIKWPDGDLEEFDMNSFEHFDGKILSSAKKD